MRLLKVNSRCVPKLQQGYPWVYAQHISDPPLLSAGELVFVGKNKPVGIGYYNPHTHIACRLLTTQPQKSIDKVFFHQRFYQALALRQRFETPFYRLIHAEGDHLPGLIIDRFNDILVCQTNTAGMEKLKPVWTAALEECLQPKQIIYRDDTPLRGKECLPLQVSLSSGESPTIIPILENGATFYADVIEGQKTGWFYDQRANRNWLSLQAKHKSILDLYTHTGGFGITALLKDASHVTFVDSSNKALSLAKQAANTNQVTSRCEWIEEEVFTLLPRLIESKQKFDIVLADPPPFIKESKYKGAGLRGYQKLAKLASQVVAPNGLLMITSCSHHASVTEFKDNIEKGIQKAGRKAKLIRKAGADKDHPVHPLLPQTHYLKALTYQLN